MTMIISKFHKLIQSKIIWGAFAFLISAAFVLIYAGPGSGGGRQDQKRAKAAQQAGELYGKTVTRTEFYQAYSAVRLLVSIQSAMDRSFQFNEEALDKETWIRIACLKKAEQMGLSLTKKAVEEEIQRNPLFINPETMQYDPAFYTEFSTKWLPNFHITPHQFFEITRENLLIEQVYELGRQSALASETEIKKTFHLYNDLLTVEYVTVPRNLVEPPEITDAEAETYYQRYSDQFVYPEAVQVEYIRFSVVDFLDQVVAPTEEVIAAVYEQNKQLFMKPADDEANEDPLDAYRPLEEVSGEIASLITTNEARRLASHQADLVVADLSNPDTTFEHTAAVAGTQVIKNLPRFTRMEPPAGIDPTVAPLFTRAAFDLDNTPTHYYSDAVVGKDEVYVIVLVKKYPAFLPEFDVVYADALDAARLEKTEIAYYTQAEAIHAAIKAGLKNGTSFSEAAATEQLQINTTAPFNLQGTLTEEFGEEIKSATAWLDQGQLTGLISTGDELLIAYMAEKKIDDESTLPEMRAMIARSIAESKAVRLTQAWQKNLLVEAGFKDLMQRNHDES